MLNEQYGIEVLLYSGWDVGASKEAGMLGTIEAGRRGKGGHSGGATLMVALEATVLYGGCGNDSEVGRGLVGLGQVFHSSGGGCAATWWHRLGADFVILWGHPLCLWIMPDC